MKVVFLTLFVAKMLGKCNIKHLFLKFRITGEANVINILGMAGVGGSGGGEMEIIVLEQQ